MSERMQPLCAWCQQRPPVDRHGRSTNLRAMYCAACLAEHRETIRQRTEWIRAAEALEIERRNQERTWVSKIVDPPPDEPAHKRRDNQDFIEEIADDLAADQNTSTSPLPICKVARGKPGRKHKRNS